GVATTNVPPCRWLRGQDPLGCGAERPLNPWWGVSGGSDHADGEELRAGVRQRLECGDLITTPKRVWGGRGTGDRCVICRETITTNEVQNVVVVKNGAMIVKLWSHHPCLTIWRDESARFEAQNPQLFPPPTA